MLLKNVLMPLVCISSSSKTMIYRFGIFMGSQSRLVASSVHIFLASCQDF
jgi:hypothetical protein